MGKRKTPHTQNQAATKKQKKAKKPIIGNKSKLPLKQREIKLQQRINNSSLSKNWQWIKEVFQEAHLPSLGLPVEWEKTKKAHTKVAYDPDTKTTYKIWSKNDKKEMQHKSSPIGFIQSTAEKNPMPGTKQPDAVRYQLFHQPEFQQTIVKDADGSPLIPCLTHGDFVKVESLQTDHLQAKHEIIKRQKALVEELNKNSAFAKYVMSLDGIDKFFVKVKMKKDTEPKFYGTVFYYELYFNDIDNLWLICQACNLHKRDKDTITWLKDQWLFGKEFLDYLHKQIIKDEGIINKINTNEGLAQLAIEWFWDRHATYIANAKKLLEDTIVPMKVLNQTLDHLIGSGKLKIAEQLEIGLQFRQAIAHTAATMEGIDAPKAAKAIGKKPLIVKNSKGQPLDYDTEAYKKTVEDIQPKVIEKVSNSASEMLENKLRKTMESKAKKATFTKK